MIVFAFMGALPAASGDDSGQARFSWAAVADSRVSGYQVHWGTASGVYTHSFDAGNVTEVIIASFAEGVEYFAAVTAYSNTGEESDYSEELSFVYDFTDRIIFLEAEDGVLTAPMQTFGDASTSWVAASPADPAAAVTLSFQVPYAADYYVWCRVRIASASDASMYVIVDEGPEQVFNVYHMPSPSLPAAAEFSWVFPSDWIWRRVPAYDVLGTGSHSIRFRGCENTLLDRVVIVSNPDFVPTNALPRSGDFVAIVDSPQDRNVTLGEGMTLSATIISTGPVNVRWFHDGVAVPNSNQTTLNLSNLQESGGGIYTLTVTLNTATASTPSARLSVLPADPNATFGVRNMRIARGGWVTFEVEGTLATELGVYTSSDLVNWSLLATRPLTGNTITITDPGAIGTTKRFYRLGESSP